MGIPINASPLYTVLDADDQVVIVTNKEDVTYMTKEGRRNHIQNRNKEVSALRTSERHGRQGSLQNQEKEKDPAEHGNKQ